MQATYTVLHQDGFWAVLKDEQFLARFVDKELACDFVQAIVENRCPRGIASKRGLLFLPGQLTDGIEPSDDPMIMIRDAAYAVSFSRRN